jgi:hypothetical protein
VLQWWVQLLYTMPGVHCAPLVGSVAVYYARTVLCSSGGCSCCILWDYIVFHWWVQLLCILGLQCAPLVGAAVECLGAWDMPSPPLVARAEFSQCCGMRRAPLVGAAAVYFEMQHTVTLLVWMIALHDLPSVLAQSVRCQHIFHR